MTVFWVFQSIVDMVMWFEFPLQHDLVVNQFFASSLALVYNPPFNGDTLVNTTESFENHKPGIFDEVLKKKKDGTQL